MTNISGASNYLNTQQLMNISDSIVGMTKTNNSSIFGDIQSLDVNKNETIDTPEAGISNLISLGNVVLNKLASVFGIQLSKPTEAPQLNTFENAQNEQIVDKYFKPLSDKAINTSDSNLIKGALDNMVSKEQIQYTFDSIVAEKEAIGVNIVDIQIDDYRKTVSFDDGSELIISNDNSLLDYSAVAKDGSNVNAEIESYGLNTDVETSKGFSVMHIVDDGNGPSQELVDSLTIGSEVMQDGSVRMIDAPGAQEIINQHSNAEIFATQVDYDRSTFSTDNINEEEISISYDKQHALENRGNSIAEVETSTKRYSSGREIY